MVEVGIIGDIILDILLVLDEFPLEDSEVMLRQEKVNLGGSAFNTAYALSKTHIRPLLLSTFGRDTAGEFIKRTLKNGPLDDTYIFRQETNTGKIYILLSPDGKRTMISSRSNRPIPFDFDVYQNFLQTINWLHVSGYLLTVGEQYERAIFAMKEAKKLGIPVSLDPGTNTLKNNPKEVLHALQYTDFFLPNREEFNLLNKIEATSQTPFQGTVIVKEGSKGVTVVKASLKQHVPQEKTLVTTNSVGAGDAFNAGFIFGMMTIGDLIRSCMNGNDFAYKRLLEQTRW